jgi:hypothetical protein
LCTVSQAVSAETIAITVRHEAYGRIARAAEGGSMSHPVVPAPLRFEAAGEREFAFRPGTTVTYAGSVVAPMAERFCTRVTRRTGVRLVPRAGHPVPGEPSVRIELAQVAGVEAAIWAETISGFDDLSFLLLPRLAGVAHKAWSAPHLAGWVGHRDRLARRGRLWTHDDLTYFRASTVDWR